MRMSRVAYLIKRGQGRHPRPPFPRCVDGLMYVESPIFDIQGAAQHTHTHTIARAHASTNAWGGEHECECERD